MSPPVEMRVKIGGFPWISTSEKCEHHADTTLWNPTHEEHTVPTPTHATLTELENRQGGC